MKAFFCSFSPIKNTLGKSDWNFLLRKHSHQLIISIDSKTINKGVSKNNQDFIPKGAEY